MNPLIMLVKPIIRRVNSGRWTNQTVAKTRMGIKKNITEWITIPR